MYRRILRTCGWSEDLSTEDAYGMTAFNHMNSCGPECLRNSIPRSPAIAPAEDHCTLHMGNSHTHQDSAHKPPSQIALLLSNRTISRHHNFWIQGPSDGNMLISIVQDRIQAWVGSLISPGGCIGVVAKEQQSPSLFRSS